MKFKSNEQTSIQANTLIEVINLLACSINKPKLKFFADMHISCEDWIKSGLLFLMNKMNLDIWGRPRIKQTPCYFADIGFTHNNEPQCEDYNFVEIKIWQYGTQNKYAKSTANDVSKLKSLDNKREYLLLVITLLDSSRSISEITSKWI